MIITRLKTNRIPNPLGFFLGEHPRLSYVVEETNAKKQTAARIEVALDEAFANSIYDSGKRAHIDSLSFELPIELTPRTRYYWRVEVWADNGDHSVSETAWFETAKLDEPWEAKWIVPEMDKEQHPVLGRTFELAGPIKSARAYVCGLGLYEMQLNGCKAGDEYLTPHFNAYQKWLQYQTYDVTDLLRQGENRVEVSLGNGLYKGRFGFEGDKSELYGSEFALLCEIRVVYADGTAEVLTSDSDWTATRSRVLSGNLYDGEVYDSTFESMISYPVRAAELGYDRLTARLSLPVVIKEELKPIEVIHTPAGETVLDMGQNMVGWMRFKTSAPKGTIIRLQHGEVLQDGNFYRDNLRTAKAEYVYTANGEETVVRPYFTFYGFRYVKVEGWPGELDPNDFTGCVLYSDLEQTGSFETSDPLVNRLFLNALWGQKGNFLDVPTDCPQRDERMGWTGDAQVFSGAACFNMDSYAFYRKYGYDMGKEQEDRGGMVPMVVPAANVQGGGSSAWADAATIIPWNAYLHYGDKAILEQQFDSMKGWVDYIIRADEGSGGRRLWTVGFHFGDWLALDGSNPDSPMGGTDTDFIASAYYAYSSRLVAKAAKVLGREDEADYYERISEEVKQAIEDEFFSRNGRLALDTQTAHAVALYMDLVPEAFKVRVREGFVRRLKLDRNHLRTGFVGTPYLNFALSDNGLEELGYTLLLNDDYPSWLYAVKLGATTIWERWNSILPDGKISGTGMNSLNHYAYGAIAEWMYRAIAGINPTEESPGFRHVELAPKPDFRLKWARAQVNAASGTYRSEWAFDDEGGLEFRFEIPFHSTARVRLPRADAATLEIEGPLSASEAAVQEGEDAVLELDSGSYAIRYLPTRSYIKILSTSTPLAELVANARALELIAPLVPPGIELNPDSLRLTIGDASPRELAVYYPMDESFLEDLDLKLKAISN
ncbi:alpha-L-rhamnosidase [Cohnella thailandensis]|uniref:alpha-L-rhamnosidase n=1 Tax=Cohnella thailandensis TaxID=557557 RepID=A0A841T0P0_9BACL|nr:alpha-L-rhamnosidase [Cohnella thailandensis]MBB6634621.1 family 78 glycoside hydrolase catalytic domain [Cohnella thailandensis]MBP1972823.1 alpha-L-rhamnosidase [Cohnella thailandensis]